LVTAESKRCSINCSHNVNFLSQFWGIPKWHNQVFFESEPSEFQNVDHAFSIIAIFAHAIPFVDILRRKSNSPALKAQTIALLEMEVAFTALLIGVILTVQGYSLADPIASVFVASIIAISGAYLLKDNVRYLIGRHPVRNL